MLHLNFTPFPILTTKRLQLRQLTTADANEILIHRSDERILEFIDIPKASTLEDALAFIHKINKGIAENESIFWGIQLKERPLLIGSICLWNISKEENSGEIGYMLHPDSQGKGIMQEALEKVIEFGFINLKLKTVVADVHPNNLKSIQLLKKNGFVYKATIKDMVVYELNDPSLSH
ncbi:MAG: GNAT family N-acetyltransferase [Chitinophagales bacterium]